MRDANVDQGRRAVLTGRLGDIRPAEIHVTSLVVYIQPSQSAEITAAIGRLPGVEIRGDNGHGKLVVVLESDGDAAMAESIGRVDRTAGVICSALVYQQSEPVAADG